MITYSIDIIAVCDIMFDWRCKIQMDLTYPIGGNVRKAIREFRKAGWIINKKKKESICPSCAKKSE